MAGLITVRLSRNDSQPWGFRLQGGKDFGAPLLVQKVNGGSLAEKAGLQVADAIIKVNGQEVFNLRHKEAQDVIVKAGSSFEVVISRSPGGTWKPAVTPVGNVPAPSPVGGAPAAVTQTSLAYKGPASPAIGSGHNLSARPFNATPQLNGVGDQGSVRAITSKQYNNPVGLYSEQAIAETLSAQTEVLTTGALGVNFMKNEKTYNSNNSEVLKLVQEIDNEPREPEPVDHPAPAGGVSVLPPPPAVSGLRHVTAPVAPATPATPVPQSPALQPGQNICADCERLIIGVFVRIKDKNLHVECFKCATCGTSLKNVGYYNINNKLYCDIHAKLVARANPPAPNLEPVTIPPGGRIPSGTFPAPPVSAGAQSPQPGTMAPLPFHPPTSSVSAPKPFGGPAAPAPAPPAPAPFSPPTFSPAPPPPAPAPVMAPAPPVPSSFPKNLPGEQFKEIEDISCCLDKSKRMSVCSSEVCDLSEKKVAMKGMAALLEEPSRASPIPFVRGDVVSEQFLASTQGAVRQSQNVQSSEQGNVQITRKSKVEETFERTQKMYTAEVTSSSQSTMQVRAASPEMEQIMAKRRAQMAYDSPNPTPATASSHFKHLQSERCLTPEMENLMNKPHGSWSPMPPACMVRPLSPNQVVSFPPDMPLPPLPANVTQPRTATPEQFQEARDTVERFVDHSKHVQQSQTTSSSRSNQTYNQQAAFSSHSQSQQYTPRFDSSQGFSPYVPRSNGANIQNGASGGHNGEPQQSNGYQQNGGNQNYSDDRNNRNQQEQRKPSDEKEPEVEEPDEREEENWSRQEEKSQRKTSDEEESSRRVFSDFGGPQVLSSVDIESTLEGGIEKTSVKKSQKTQYASCEFETSRKSAVHQHDKSSEAEKPSPAEKPSQEGPPPSNQEETMTKSQVEEIIKQELNKVFHMAQTMEKTDYSQMYNQQSQAEQQSKRERDHAHEKSSKSKVEQKAISSQYDVIKKTGKLTSALTTAPARSFTPQPLENNYPLPYQNLPSDFPPPRSHPEPPVVEKPGYIPITGGRDSPLVKALTIACDRPYSPLPIPTAPEVPKYATQPNRSSMLEALTTAPTTPFQIRPPSAAGEGSVSESKQILKSTETRYESVQKFAPKPTRGDFKPISMSTGTSQKQQVQDELKSAFKSTSKVQSTFASSETKHTDNIQQRTLTAPKTVERPITPSGLHAPSLLPYYQQNIGEIPLAHRSNSPIPHQIKAPSVTPPRAQSVPRQGERRGSVKAMSEAYVQQVSALNTQQTSPSPVVGASSSSVSYVSAGAYSKGSTVTKTYSYQQEHKSIDSGSYHASPLAGKLPLAGEPTMPKCSSPVLGKLDHTKQVFKPSIPAQQPTTAFRSPVAEQANLKQAPTYFVEEKDKTQAPWVVVKDKENEGNKVSFKPTQLSLPSRLNNLPNLKPNLPGVNKPAEIPKPASLPGVTKPPSLPDVGPGAPKGGATGSTSAPRRGRGVLNAAVAAGGRVPLCGSCSNPIRGPFITALGKIWCPDHFVCVNQNCRRPLQDIGFVEDVQGLYCEFCFEQYLAPACSKCNAKIKGDCLNAIGKHFHPECFTCAYCGKLFGNSPFFLEDALPYCEADWNELFTTKCFSCGFPIEAGDRWVEALNNNYHSQCFNCTMCKKNLEGQSFFAKGGRPFCKNHAR